MGVTVGIYTYKRSWALAHSLESIKKQTVLPEEVLIVLKPSGDGSESIISDYSGKLPIRLIVQNSGNATDAVDIIIKKAKKEIILFIDDDAVADSQWLEKYSQIFEKDKVCAGAYGINYIADVKDELILEDVEGYIPKPTYGPHREPMGLFNDYFAWISTSGLTGVKKFPKKICKSALLMGVNMGFKRSVVKDAPLGTLYRGSRTGLLFEQLLAYYVRKKGFHTYLINDKRLAPIVWHIHGKNSLSRGDGFNKKFWLQFDSAVMYWRLKSIGGEVSILRYFFGLAVACRSNTIPNFFGSAAGVLWGSYILLKYNTRLKKDIKKI